MVADEKFPFVYMYFSTILLNKTLLSLNYAQNSTIAHASGVVTNHILSLHQVQTVVFVS